AQNQIATGVCRETNRTGRSFGCNSDKYSHPKGLLPRNVGKTSSNAVPSQRWSRVCSHQVPRQRASTCKWTSQSRPLLRYSIMYLFFALMSSFHVLCRLTTSDRRRKRLVGCDSSEPSDASASFS